MGISVVIAAAGRGKRMKANQNKQYLLLEDKPILAHTLEVFENCKSIDEIIIVTGSEEIEFCRNEIVEKYAFHKVSKVIAGGAERQDSVYQGLLAASSACDVVLVHDGARPFVSEREIEESIAAVKQYEAVGIGVPVKDTIKVVDQEGFAVDTPQRSTLWAIQTPQTFLYPLLRAAYEKAYEDDFLGTDDTMLVERLGKKIKMIEGSYENIKMTTPEDLFIGEAILQSRRREKRRD